MPVIGKITDLPALYIQYKLLLVTIGNSALREKVYKTAEEVGCGFPNIIHPLAYISPRAHMGTGNIVLNNVVIQNNVKLDNGCILNPGVELHHDSMIGNNVLIYTNSVVCFLTQVEDRVWIGLPATIATGAKVLEGSRVEGCIVIF